MRRVFVLICASTTAGCLNVVAQLTPLADAGQTDAGLDAVPDAGLDAGDAGVPDAGGDAGPPDAGADAGRTCLPDSGAPFICTLQSAPTFGTDAMMKDSINAWDFTDADLNHDGLDDLLKVGGTAGLGHILVYYGLSDGGLTPGPTFYPTGLFVAVGDLDGDGWPDFVSDTTVEFNQRDGTFAAQTLQPTQGVASSALIADLDGDGRPDISYCTTAGVETFFDQGGTFDRLTAPTLVEPDPCEGLAIADLDEDGLPDLAETQLVYLGPPTNQTVLVRFGLGQRMFSAANSYDLGLPGFDIRAADMYGSGWPDLVVAAGDRICILQNQGCGFFGNTVLHLQSNVPPSASLVRLLVGELDGDCYPEVVVWGSSVCDQSPSGDVVVYHWSSGTNVATVIQQPWGVTLWQPGTAPMPSLVLGEFCSGSFSVLPNQSQ